jgi:hypothetical protein
LSLLLTKYLPCLPIDSIGITGKNRVIYPQTPDITSPHPLHLPLPI